MCQLVQSWWAPVIRRKHVQILSDNVTTVACINHLYHPSSVLVRLAQAVWVESQYWQVELKTKYLAAETMWGQTDYQGYRPHMSVLKLNRRVFIKLDSHPLSTHLSVSRSNVGRHRLFGSTWLAGQQQLQRYKSNGWYSTMLFFNFLIKESNQFKAPKFTIILYAVK